MKRSFLLILFISVSIFPALLTAQAPEGAAVPAGQQTSTEVPPAKAAGPVPAQNQAPDSIPRLYVELWNTGNFDQVASLFSPPVAMVSRGNRVLMTFEMLKRVITAWRKSMPDLHFTIEDTIIEGDKVVMRLSFTGSYKERLFPGTAAPTPEIPRTVRATEMLIFHLKDGKINQIWEEYDEVRMRVEMGGSWHTNEELEAMTSRAPKPAGNETPAPAPPPKR
jgi:predicted ester cyclase